MAVTIRDIRVNLHSAGRHQPCGGKSVDQRTGALWTGMWNLCLPPPGCEAGSRRIFEASSGWKKCREYRRSVAVDEPERILEKRPY